MVWPFTLSVSDRLYQIQVHQQFQSAKLIEIQGTVSLIEKRLSGYVDPNLIRAIARLSVSVGDLDAAIKKHNESKK